MKYLLLLVPLAALAVLFLLIEGAAPIQYDPMSLDEEREWLRTHGLTEAEIDEIQRPMRRS